MRPFEERLWERVDKVSSEAGCWLWTGALVAGGYGTVSRNMKMLRVHRVTYELLVGPIPAGLQLDHLCRNRACCNPGHLEPVTAKENFRRGESPAARMIRENVCRRGHEMTEENTYRPPSGERICRACARANKVAGRDRANELRREKRRRQREESAA